MAYRDIRFAILSPGEAARELGISARTLERYVHAGKILPSHYTPGGHARFARAAIEAMLAPCEGPAPSMVAAGSYVATPVACWTSPAMQALHAEQDRAAKTGRAARHQQAKAAAIEKRRQDQAAFVEHCRAFLAERFGMTRPQLYDLVWSAPVERAAARFSISGNALRKTCRRYQIPVPTRGYWRNLTAKRRTTAYCQTPLPPLKAPKRKQPRWRGGPK